MKKLIVLALLALPIVAQTSGFGYTPVYTATVNNSTGAFTCDFSKGNICLVNNNYPSMTTNLVATITNLPTNQYVQFIFESQLLFGINWPSNVYCEQFGGWDTCADLVGGAGQGWGVQSPLGWRGSGPSVGYSVSDFWSDGSNIWAVNGSNPSAQNLNVSSLQTGTLQLFVSRNGSFSPATVTLGFGSEFVLSGSSYISSQPGTFWTDVVQTAVASASTIAPGSRVFHVTGTTTINTITVPSACTQVSGSSCELKMIPDGAFATSTSGNIALASTAVVNKVLTMTYDANTAKWYPSY